MAGFFLQPDKDKQFGKGSKRGAEDTDKKPGQTGKGSKSALAFSTEAGGRFSEVPSAFKDGKVPGR